MHRDQHSLLSRPDTFFGVCEGLGQDFRIHPNFLRLGFAGFLFWNPVGALLTYLALGAVVAAARFIVPEPRAASPVSGDERAEARQGAEIVQPAPTEDDGFSLAA